MPMRLAAALGDEAQERADAAADVEHALAGLEPDAPERRLVGRELLVLAERPVVGTGAPERPPAGRAAGSRRMSVVMAAPSVRLRSVVIDYDP